MDRYGWHVLEGIGFVGFVMSLLALSAGEAPWYLPATFVIFGLFCRMQP